MLIIGISRSHFWDPGILHFLNIKSLNNQLQLGWLLSFPHSWLITWFVTKLTRRVPLVEQELLTLLEHLSSPPVFSGVRVTRSLVLCVCFVDRCLSIVLSVLLWYTDSDYPFGIFKLFSNCITIDGVQDCKTEIVSPVLFYHCISYVDHMLLQILI